MNKFHDLSLRSASCVDANALRVAAQTHSTSLAGILFLRKKIMRGEHAASETGKYHHETPHGCGVRLEESGDFRHIISWK